MICSSLNLDPFIVRPLSGGGLYLNLEEDQGLRSPVLRQLNRLLRFDLIQHRINVISQRHTLHFAFKTLHSTLTLSTMGFRFSCTLSFSLFASSLIIYYSFFIRVEGVESMEGVEASRWGN